MIARWRSFVVAGALALTSAAALAGLILPGGGGAQDGAPPSDRAPVAARTPARIDDPRWYGLIGDR